VDRSELGTRPVLAPRADWSELCTTSLGAPKDTAAELQAELKGKKPSELRDGH